MAEFVDPEDLDEHYEDNVRDNYRKFRDGEDVPVHLGIYVEDINDLETGHWERTGQRGAFVNLYGQEGVDDIQLHELEPEGETTRQHHLYDELVYVSQGQGLTAIGPPDDETIFEWQKGALFCIPPSVPYRHVNTSDEESARLVAHTPLPELMNLVKDNKLVFHPEDIEWDQYSESLYSSEGELFTENIGRLAWDANFVPNVNEFDKLEYWDKVGALRMVVFPMSPCSTYAHIGDLPSGQYKTAHRHSPGANVMILSGEGYSLIWPGEWDKKVEFEWKPGSMFTPPTRWYHQHFNCTDEPARTMALHSPRIGTLNRTLAFGPQVPENIIEYVKEEPAIREKYESEIEARGLESRMPAEAYTDPDFEW